MRNGSVSSHSDVQGVELHLRRVFLCFLLIATAMVPIHVLAPAWASNWGSAGQVGTGGATNGVFLQPSSNMHFCGRMPTGWATQARIAQQEFNATSVNMSTSFGPDVACGTGNQVYVLDFGDNGLRGWNACFEGHQSGSHPNMTCDRQWVRVNTNYVTSPEIRIFCHELGHALGLRHTMAADSCMRTTASGGTHAAPNAHDREHLNDHY